MAETAADAGVMIALLPVTSDWCKLELPHLTLVYAGPRTDLKDTDFNELAKDACSLATMSNPIWAPVMGVDHFDGSSYGYGTDKVDVLKLQPTPELMAMRRVVERWNKSEHPFVPHCTIGPTGTFMEQVPRSLAFNRVCVGWGEDYIHFNMGAKSSY